MLKNNNILRLYTIIPLMLTIVYCKEKNLWCRNTEEKENQKIVELSSFRYVDLGIFLYLLQDEKIGLHFFPEIIMMTMRRYAFCFDRIGL